VKSSKCKSVQLLYESRIPRLRDFFWRMPLYESMIQVTRFRHVRLL